MTHVGYTDEDIAQTIAAAGKVWAHFVA